MEIFIFLIPIITVTVLVWKYRKETAWWEYILVVLPSLLLYVLLKFGLIYCNSLDTEYLGDLVNTVIYYEDWDETVMVAHTYTTGSGKDQVTHTYYVPERKYHPEEYVYTTMSGDNTYIDDDDFEKIIHKLNVKPVFKDMHRNYRSKDGDAYVYTWNRTRENAYPITETHAYTNKVKASSYSIFKYSNMSEQDVKDNKLFEYPDIVNYDQNPILGYKASIEDENAVRYLNGYRGPKNQIRVFILCFDNSSLEVAEMQKAYWQGGNKNEFVVCLGIKGDSVIWCNPFSWCDEPLLEVKTRDYFITHPHINFKDYAEWLDLQIDNNWHRKSFEDFNYINISLSNTEYIIILILVLLYNIGISYWVVVNEFTENDPLAEHSSKRWKHRYKSYRYY